MGRLAQVRRMTEFERHVLARLDVLSDRVGENTAATDVNTAALEALSGRVGALETRARVGALTQATPPPDPPTRAGGGRAAVVKGTAAGSAVALAVTALLDWLVKR